MSCTRVVIAFCAAAVALAQCSDDSCGGHPEDSVTLMQLVSRLKERPQRTDLDHKVRLTQRYIQEATGDGDGDGANATGDGDGDGASVAEVFTNYESPSSYIFNITGQALPHGRANFTVTVTTTSTTTTVCDNTTNCTLFVADNNDTSEHQFAQELMPDTTTSTVSRLLFAATTTLEPTTTPTSTWPTIFAPQSTVPPLGAFNPNQPGGGQYPAPMAAYPMNVSDGNITDNNGMTNITLNGTSPDVAPPGAQIPFGQTGVAIPMAPVLPTGVVFNLPTPMPPYGGAYPGAIPGVPMGAPPGVPVYTQPGAVLPPPAVPAAPPAPPKPQLTPLQKVFNRAIQQGA